MRRCDPGLVALDADRDAVVHGHRERLRAAHAAEPGGQRDGAGQRAAEPLVGDRGERLEGALQDALGADVDPRAGGHLAVHRQPEVLEPAELLPVGPVADQVGVGDQHPRRPLVGAHHADRLAGLHEQRLVVLQRGQRADDRVVGLPARGRPCRCRRRRRGPRGARRSPGRGCSSASAAAPRSASSSRSARGRAARAPHGVPWSCQFSHRVLDSAHQGAAAYVVEGVLDLGGEVPVRAGTLDVAAQQRDGRGGGRRRARAGRAGPARGPR